MGYTCKNYMTEGGDKTVIGGTLEILEGATVTGLPSTPAATTAAAGLVKQAANVPEATGDNPTAAEFKALLDALIAAGVMAAAE